VSGEHIAPTVIVLKNVVLAGEKWLKMTIKMVISWANQHIYIYFPLSENR
jgi:hypothetical protein